MLLRIIVFIVIVGGGVGVYFISNLYFSSVEEEAAENARIANSLTRVLVFKSNLRRGTKISEIDVEWQDRKSGDYPSDAVEYNPSRQDIVNTTTRYIAVDVRAGELVTEDKLLSGNAGFMALAIGPGMRALAIPTNTVQLAGGFVQPEDRLDIIHTIVRDLDGDGIANGISEIILENVRVLAVGATASENTTAKTTTEQTGVDVGSNKVLLAETITLELSEQQAKLLVSAGTIGSITFAIRPINNPSDLTRIGQIRTVGQEKVGGNIDDIYEAQGNKGELDSGQFSSVDGNQQIQPGGVYLQGDGISKHKIRLISPTGVIDIFVGRTDQ